MRPAGAASAPVYDDRRSSHDETAPIRILEPDTNRRGDLFARLMADLFVALGYGTPRLNVQKTGRELDLVATHRIESRRAVAECKATERPIGGADLDKFVGTLDAEHEDELPLTGYFISLAGFTESALEQERRRRRTALADIEK
ncbi:MAG TPA: restriction endonuclease [Thermoanaerobaculia bacterium]|nr:restriction endonuclease [Thermoanaerobaculia bacterium]